VEDVLNIEKVKVMRDAASQPQCMAVLVAPARHPRCRVTRTMSFVKRRDEARLGNAGEDGDDVERGGRVQEMPDAEDGVVQVRRENNGRQAGR